MTENISMDAILDISDITGLFPGKFYKKFKRRCCKDKSWPWKWWDNFFLFQWTLVFTKNQINFFVCISVCLTQKGGLPGDRAEWSDEDEILTMNEFPRCAASCNASVWLSAQKTCSHLEIDFFDQLPLLNTIILWALSGFLWWWWTQSKPLPSP